MITKLHLWRQEKQSFYWFVPAVMVLDAVVLATVLIIVDATGRHLPVLSRISDQKSRRTNPALPGPKPQEKA